MSRSALKYRVIQPLEKFLVIRPVRLAWRLGFGPPGDALFETIGQRTSLRYALTLILYEPRCSGPSAIKMSLGRGY